MKILLVIMNFSYPVNEYWVGGYGVSIEEVIEKTNATVYNVASVSE